MAETLLETIRALCEQNSVSGQEEETAQAICSRALKLGYALEQDRLGNLTFYKGKPDPARPRVMLSAHMDEVGLLATYLEEDGMVRFTCVGGIDPRVLPGRQVYLPRTKCWGVIGIKPIHLTDSDQRGKAAPAEDLMVDLGADTKEAAQKLVEPGDPIVFSGSPQSMGRLLRAKALDDRAGCGVLLHLMEQMEDPNLLFCFLVQEEVGCRGAKAAAQRWKPDYALVLEATTAADLAGVSPQKQVCRLGQGAVVGFMDRSTIYNKQLYQAAFRLAEEQGIPIQTKTMVAGGNDAGAIHTAAGGVKTLAISLPCRYLHSPSCVIDPEDGEAVLKLTRALALEILSGRLE